ncbi:ABC transporter permease [Umezawaea sp. Da 62-37]|uniref:ABC transporter permease n=1 Tax=Umezawaea sp. Da 62-37 TaxID=3075927 RepID=UPI0028F718DE|nr:ABC transporter permease [Umezawaea sp. Da 62-37]WNV87947.1 ABC transporter permease [Umezawaea sp. Da 62-37]
MTGRRWPTRGALVLVALGVFAVVAPLLAPYSPTAVDTTAAFAPVSVAHPLGTDNLGRDVLSRVLHAARTDVLLALVVTLVPLLVGTAVGVGAGWWRGWRAAAVLRVVDAVAAFPSLVLVVGLLAVTGPGLTGLLIAVPAAGWAPYARIAAAEASVAARSGVVEAQRGFALPARRIVLRYVAPHAARPCIAYGTADFAGNLVLIASVSYLGVGVQPPLPEWGAMIAEAQPYLSRGWLPAGAAAAAIVAVALCVGVAGDRVTRGAAS